MLDIGWPADLTWYRLLTDWGSLIGGFFALIAGAALYVIGRVQVRATTEAADKEIAATREAISAAQEQTRVTLRVERRRIARESYAFHAMLDAAMGIVVEDIEAARRIFAPESHHFLGESVPAYQARQQIKKTAFADLRSACVRLGGQLTTPFLSLDKTIDEFAADWITIPSAGDPIRMGRNAALNSWLEIIHQQAVALREEANNEMKRCTAVLAETQGSEFL